MKQDETLVIIYHKLESAVKGIEGILDNTIVLKKSGEERLTKKLKTLKKITAALYGYFLFNDVDIPINEDDYIHVSVQDALIELHKIIVKIPRLPQELYARGETILLNIANDVTDLGNLYETHPFFYTNLGKSYASK